MKQFFYLGALCFLAFALSACAGFGADEAAPGEMAEETVEESAPPVPSNTEITWACDCLGADDKVLSSVTGFGLSVPARKKSLETCKKEHSGTSITNCKPAPAE